MVVVSFFIHHLWIFFHFLFCSFSLFLSLIHLWISLIELAFGLSSNCFSLMCCNNVTHFFSGWECTSWNVSVQLWWTTTNKVSMQEVDSTEEEHITKTKSRCILSPVPPQKMPTESELEGFFAAAEKDIQKHFGERVFKMWN